MKPTWALINLIPPLSTPHFCPNGLIINKGHKDLNGELQTKLSKKEQEVVALYENVKIKDKIITKLKDRIQEIIKQLVHLCKTE